MAAPYLDTPYPGIQRRTTDTAQSTIVEYAFAPGATFPLHRHPQEQLVVVLQGSVELIAGGRSQALGEGGWAAIAGNEEHGISAGNRGARFLAILVPRRAPDELQLTLTRPDPEH